MAMKTIEQLNIEKLNELIKRMGSKAEFSRFIDKSPAQLSQWVSGYRNIGTSTKRDIEDKFNLPSGWFDTEEQSNKIIIEDAIEEATNTVKLELLYPNRECQSHELDKLIMRFVMTKQTAIELLGTDKLDHIKLYQPLDDGMEPKAPKSSMILINIDTTRFSEDGIYLFTFQGKEYFRRLTNTKGNVIKVSADNPAYHVGNFDIFPNEINDLVVIGKAWKALPINYIDL